MLIKRGGEEKIISVIDVEDDIDDVKTANAFKIAKESIKNIDKDGNKTELEIEVGE